VLLLCAACMAGCTYYGAVRLQSTPAGAEVVNLADDNLIGTAPQEVYFSSMSSGPKMVTVRFQKLGYADKTTAFTVEINQSSKEKALLNAKAVQVELEKK
jgi:hypothetical protein